MEDTDKIRELETKLLTEFCSVVGYSGNLSKARNIVLFVTHKLDKNESAKLEAEIKKCDPNLGFETIVSGRFKAFSPS